MEFEKPHEMERVGKNREKLLALEREGKYVFHGSPEIIETLEPRQAYNENKKTGKMEKDGDPAVSSTQYADIAIFCALIKSQKTSGEICEFGFNEKQPSFSATKKLLEDVKNITGRVYVCDKEKFIKFDNKESRCYETVTPIEVIEVAADDLPKNINIIEIKKIPPP